MTAWKCRFKLQPRMRIQCPNPDRNMKIHEKISLVVHILHKLKSKIRSFPLLVEESKGINKTYNASASHLITFFLPFAIAVPRIQPRPLPPSSVSPRVPWERGPWERGYQEQAITFNTIKEAKAKWTMLISSFSNQ